MKLIKPNFSILEQPPGLEGIYQQIEKAGRICYKSEDKITEGSAKAFVDRMIKSGHTSMLEHSAVYLDFRGTDIIKLGKFYRSNPYSKVYKHTLENGWYEPHLYVSTNYRVIVENDKFDDLKYLCEPTKYHERRVSVKFITSNSIMREFTRHRSHSFAVESTRYCNYSRDKFNNEITFIKPSWMNESSNDVQNYLCGQEHNMSPGSIHLINALSQCEACYLSMIQDGMKPQEAREVLPLAIKCDMIMTGFVLDWQHFFDLRASIIAATGKPHPDASALADPLYEEFIKRKYINN